MQTFNDTHQLRAYRLYIRASPYDKVQEGGKIRAHPRFHGEHRLTKFCHRTRNEARALDSGKSPHDLVPEMSKGLLNFE